MRPEASAGHQRVHALYVDRPRFRHRNQQAFNLRSIVRSIGLADAFEVRMTLLQVFA